MNNRVYLGLGSNSGDRCSLIQHALSAIATLSQVQMRNISSFYETSPVSPIAQRDFINCVCALDTTLSPEDFYEALHRIEVQLGKVPKEKNAPRPIDIDILLFGMHYRSEGLLIPHPRWSERLFVLVPLSEIAKDIVVPVNEQGACETVCLKELLKTFPNPHRERVKRLDAMLHCKKAPFLTVKN